MQNLNQPPVSHFPENIDPNGVLKTEFLGTSFRSPLVVASGTLIERVENIQPFLDRGAGAVVPRTTRYIMERTVHPSPHLYQEGSRSSVTMLNAEWTGADIGYWRPYLEKMSDSSQVIMSVSGRIVEDCVKVCEELDEYAFPYLELNVGCGATNGVIGYITRDEDHISRLVNSVKEAGVKTPIAVKLGHSDLILHLSNVAKEAGADAIVAINTLGPMLDFSIDSSGIPHRVLGIKGARGGLSGSAIFHTALTDVALISKDVNIPVIASGGVTTPERAIKMIYAGASLVQIYSYLHDRGTKAPEALEAFTKALVLYMEKHEIDDIGNIRGVALPLLDEPTELNPQIPTINETICTGCDRCVPVCLPKAIDTNNVNNKNGHVASVIGSLCVGCGICVAVCPVDKAISL